LVGLYGTLNAVVSYTQIATDRGKEKQA